jgi:hypothetical protein
MLNYRIPKNWTPADFILLTLDVFIMCHHTHFTSGYTTNSTITVKYSTCSPCYYEAFLITTKNYQDGKVFNSIMFTLGFHDNFSITIYGTETQSKSVIPRWMDTNMPRANRVFFNE